MNATCWQGLVSVLITVGVLQAEAATYQQQVNATRAAAVARGSNSVVVMVEAPSPARDGKVSARHFAPDANNAGFRNVDIQVDARAQASAHGTTVAQLFFGSRRSIARGVDTAHVFQSGSWLGRLSQWDLDPSHVAALFPGPVVNHSHVAGRTDSAKLLRRADYSALSNNVLHVAGVRRSGAGAPLMAGAYNALVVGGALRNIETPYPDIDAFYGGGRTRPHLVVPFAHASAAAPVVSAAAVRLNALAAQKKLTFPTTSRHGSDQLPVELIRAILMASASGNFQFTLKDEVMVNGFGTVGVTANGLDKRFGMGMLDVGAAESILNASGGPQAPYVAATGESGGGAGARQSAMTMTSKCDSPASGYSYHSGFSGTDNELVSYHVTPPAGGTLTASLVWLADLSREGSELVGHVDDFDLRLVDAGGETAASSTATQDTTENIRTAVKGGRTYQLEVSRKGDITKPWPFAIAWHLSN